MVEICHTQKVFKTGCDIWHFTKHAECEKSHRFAYSLDCIGTDVLEKDGYKDDGF